MGTDGKALTETERPTGAARDAHMAIRVALHELELLDALARIEVPRRARIKLQTYKQTGTYEQNGVALNTNMPTWRRNLKKHTSEHHAVALETQGNMMASLYRNTLTN